MRTYRGIVIDRWKERKKSNTIIIHIAHIQFTSLCLFFELKTEQKNNATTNNEMIRVCVCMRMCSIWTNAHKIITIIILLVLLYCAECIVSFCWFTLFPLSLWIYYFVHFFFFFTVPLLLFLFTKVCILHITPIFYFWCIQLQWYMQNLWKCVKSFCILNDQGI